MARSKRDILDTEAMLERLTHMLIKHAPAGTPMDGYGGTARNDAEALRRISMTLHRWHELECGDSNDHASWCITRGRISHPFNAATGKRDCNFDHDENSAPYIERHIHTENKARYESIPDRETGALKRLKAIMARYPTLGFYVQDDPRGAALYILRPGDVPAGENADAYYSRGVAVYK